MQVQEVHQWLRSVCRAAVQPDAATVDGLTADALRAVREEVYPPAADNAYVHLRVAEFSDQVSALPAEVRPRNIALRPPHCMCPCWDVGLCWRMARQGLQL